MQIFWTLIMRIERQGQTHQLSIYWFHSTSVHAIVADVVIWYDSSSLGSIWNLISVQLSREIHVDRRSLKFLLRFRRFGRRLICSLLTWPVRVSSEMNLHLIRVSQSKSFYPWSLFGDLGHWSVILDLDHWSLIFVIEPWSWSLILDGNPWSWSLMVILDPWSWYSLRDSLRSRHTTDSYCRRNTDLQ